MPPKKTAVKKKPPKKVAPAKKKVKDEDDDEEDDDEEEEEAPKKKGKTKAKPKDKGKKGGVDWQAMLDSLESGGVQGNIFFPKSGKTRLKLVLEDEDDEESWYTEVQGEFNGKVRTRYLLRGIVLFPAQEDKKILGITVAKTAMKQIVGFLTEKYDLFDIEEGHGITLSKTGADLNTSWAATPSPKPVEIDDLDEYEDLEITLEELEAQLEEIAAKNKKKEKKGKKGKDKDEDEEDDEEEDW